MGEIADAPDIFTYNGQGTMDKVQWTRYEVQWTRYEVQWTRYPPPLLRSFGETGKVPGFAKATPGEAKWKLCEPEARLT